MHRRSLSAVMWWNASSVDVKMESYVNNYGSTERNKCFANRDGWSIKWNNTLKALEILLKLDHIVKGNNIAEVWVGRGTTAFNTITVSSNCLSGLWCTTDVYTKINFPELPLRNDVCITMLNHG